MLHRQWRNTLIAKIFNLIDENGSNCDVVEIPCQMNFKYNNINRNCFNSIECNLKV